MNGAGARVQGARAEGSPNDSTPYVDYETVENTVWPVSRSLEWVLRYAPQDTPHLAAASVVAAYAYLCNPNLTEVEAVAALGRARRAHKQFRTPK
jgi:hypothetical protein